MAVAFSWVVKRCVDTVAVEKCWLFRRWATSRPVLFSQSQPLLQFGVGMPHYSLLVPQAGLLSGRRFGVVSLTLPNRRFWTRSLVNRRKWFLFNLPACSSPMSWAPISATVLFPCGVGRVASRLLSKLVGLYHRVIYVGSLWKVLDGLRLADTNTHAIQCSFFKLISSMALSQNWSMFFV